MLEPEYLGIACPECRKREVYLDREIGFYCMICGRQFSTEEIRLLAEAEILQTDRATREESLDKECGLPTKLPTDQMKSEGSRHGAAAIHEIPNQKKTPDDRERASHKKAIR